MGNSQSIEPLRMISSDYYYHFTAKRQAERQLYKISDRGKTDGDHNPIECNQGDAACTSHAVTSNLPPATVSGSTACANPGNSGWCRGGATLNLTGTDPVSGWTITAIESDLFGNLCTGSSPTLSCTWTFPEGTTSLNFWADSSHGDTSLESSASMKLDSAAPTVSISQTSGTAGNAGWYTSPVTFTGMVSDPSPSSGIALTQYVLDGGAPQDGGSVTVSSDGSHTVYFTAEDVAGNASAPSATDLVLYGAKILSIAKNPRCGKPDGTFAPFTISLTQRLIIFHSIT